MYAKVHLHVIKLLFRLTALNESCIVYLAAKKRRLFRDCVCRFVIRTNLPNPQMHLMNLVPYENLSSEKQVVGLNCLSFFNPLINLTRIRMTRGDRIDAEIFCLVKFYDFLRAKLCIDENKIEQNQNNNLVN